MDAPIQGLSATTRLEVNGNIRWNIRDSIYLDFYANNCLLYSRRRNQTI